MIIYYYVYITFSSGSDVAEFLIQIDIVEKQGLFFNPNEMET